MAQRNRASSNAAARRAGAGSPVRPHQRPPADGRRGPGRDGRESGAGDAAARRARLRDVVEPVVTAAGYDLEDVSISRAGRRHLVRIIVDGDGGVSLDAVADVSRAVSTALDEAEATSGDLIAGEYQLEVSSPGVDRPLILPRHWRRNIGRLVKVGLRSAADRQVVARVLDADDTTVVLGIDGDSLEVPHQDLGPGRVQVEFSRGADGDDEFADLNGGDDVDEFADGDGDDDEVEDEER